MIEQCWNCGGLLYAEELSARLLRHGNLCKCARCWKCNEPFDLELPIMVIVDYAGEEFHEDCAREFLDAIPPNAVPK